MSTEVNTPKHVAIIMDGNGRWAKLRGQERINGHVQGVESVRKVIHAAVEKGVEYLTLYAFSTENWMRPKEEVEGLMRLLVKHIVQEVPELKEQGVRLRFIGDIGSMPEEIRRSTAQAEEETQQGGKLTLIVALNYSSRWEITRMAQRLAKAVAEDKIKVEDISAGLVGRCLDTAEYPDPDLIIRTSGEYRLSNFLLWQAAYSEFYFTEVLWPDFDREEFARALEAYGKRQRRFGGVK